MTGKVPTPIPARDPVSPLGPRKVSGKLFDLIMEGQNASNQSNSSSSNALLSLQSLESSTLSGMDSSLLESFANGNSQLTQFLQNPTLAKYMLQYLKG